MCLSLSSLMTMSRGTSMVLGVRTGQQKKSLISELLWVACLMVDILSFQVTTYLCLMHLPLVCKAGNHVCNRLVNWITALLLDFQVHFIILEGLLSFSLNRVCWHPQLCCWSVISLACPCLNSSPVYYSAQETTRNFLSSLPWSSLGSSSAKCGWGSCCINFFL